MNTINQKVQSGERALFQCKDTKITHTIFENGESPLKGSSNIELQDSILKWKYPFWYSNKIKIDDSLLQDGARAGIWYTDEIEISDTVIEAPKAFRRCKQIKLHHVDMLNANETLWMCQDVEMINVTAKGDYFAMNTSNITAENFNLVGNYSFDGGKNITVTHSKLLSKDAFWNCDNVTVENSFISGEYIGWNSRNLTFINCTIESLQGFCYIDGLILINCRLLNTTLAFEYCKNINIDVTTTINSIKNPINGTICSAGIDNIIFDDPNINPYNTLITLRNS